MISSLADFATFYAKRVLYLLCFGVDMLLRKEEILTGILAITHMLSISCDGYSVNFNFTFSGISGIYWLPRSTFDKLWPETVRLN